MGAKTNGFGGGSGGIIPPRPVPRQAFPGDAVVERILYHAFFSMPICMTSLTPWKKLNRLVVMCCGVVSFVDGTRLKIWFRRLSESSSLSPGTKHSLASRQPERSSLQDGHFRIAHGLGPPLLTALSREMCKLDPAPPLLNRPSTKSGSDRTVRRPPLSRLSSLQYD